VLYVFDPRRVALLLLGGDKTGDSRWYDKAIPQAEKIYAKHLEAQSTWRHWDEELGKDS
jgi:hypothetical protein